MSQRYAYARYITNLNYINSNASKTRKRRAIDEIFVDGIKHQRLQRNGMIEAFINKKEKEHVKQLPYVKDIG